MSGSGRTLQGGRTHIYLVELTKLQELLQKPIDKLTPAEMWAVYIKYVDDESKRPMINNLIKREKGLEMASNMLRKIAQDDEMRIAVYAREKAELDRQAELASVKKAGIQEGLQKGRQEGRQEGLQEGLQKGKREMIHALFEQGGKIDFISKVADMSIEEIKTILNQQ